MSSRGRVFLLDDDELIVSMLARALTREGYEVQAETVPDGVVKKIRLFTPDVVLLDIKLPAAGAEATPVELDNLTCTTVDVGAGGMRLRTGYRLRVGQRLQARVLRPRDPCASYMRPKAEVVWLDPKESGFSGGLRWLSGATPGQTS